MALPNIPVRITGAFHLCRGHTQPDLVPYWCRNCKIEADNQECFFYESTRRMVYNVQPIINNANAHLRQEMRKRIWGKYYEERRGK